MSVALEMLTQTAELLKKVKERMNAAGFRAEFDPTRNGNAELVVWIGSNITNDQRKLSLDLNDKDERIDWCIRSSSEHQLAPTGVFFSKVTNTFMCREPSKTPEGRLIELVEEQDKNLRDGK